MITRQPPAPAAGKWPYVTFTTSVLPAPNPAARAGCRCATRRLYWHRRSSLHGTESV
jgi:hypothetical protein